MVIVDTTTTTTSTPNHNHNHNNKTTSFNNNNHKTTPFNYNNNAGIPAQQRRPKSREVSSRYLSTSSSSSSSNSSTNFSTSSNRAVSAERRRPMTPKTVSSAAKMLMSSSRSLSVSFQGESFALPKGRVNTRRDEVTPVKRPSEQPWPGRVVSLSGSVDLGCDRRKLGTVGSDKVVRVLKPSLDPNSPVPRTGSRKIVSDSDQNSSLFRKSDTDSVSSGGNSGSQDGDFKASLKLSGGRSLIVVPKHWGESKRGGIEPSSPMGRGVPPKLNAPRKIRSESPVESPRRALSSRVVSSPVRGNVRPASPSKMGLDRSGLIRGNVRPASPSKVGLDRSSPSIRGNVRPSSPSKVGLDRSSTIRGNVRPSSPSMVGLDRSSSLRGNARPASPSTVGLDRSSSTIRGNLRPASPSTVGLDRSSPSISGNVRPASPSKVGLDRSSSLSRGNVRAASPSKVGLDRSSSSSRGNVRAASPSKVGLDRSSSSSFGNVRPASPSKVGLDRSSPSIRGNVRPASPSKMGLDRSSSSIVIGRMASPSRVRSAVGSTPSVLCYRADVRTVKVGDNRLGDVHLLRRLHNRHLQWRFANAKAEASLSIQQTNAERSLYNAWKATSDLCGAVSSKRQLLQWLRLKLKIVSILKSQILHLEEWALIEKDHCTSLSGATESLTATTIRLPLIGGARADIQDLKDAICSAADVMHLMASSICALSPKVEEMNALVGEVASLTSKERSFLSMCKDTLSTLAAMQVKDCSLRAHILQLKCALSSLTGEV